MKRIFAIIASAFSLPGTALAATRTYEVGAFEVVSVASGVEADVSVGSSRSVVAETRSDDFDDLQISVEDKVLRIERPARSWLFSLFSGGRPGYQVHVVTPTLHSVVASSGADVTVKGSVEGDFSVTASSGSEVEVSLVNGGNVKVSASSGSDIGIAGSCVSLEAQASSGSDLDAQDLKCGNVTVQASSGSDISVAATTRVTGSASSGSDIRIRGQPPVVQVETSSGSAVAVKE